MLLHFNGDLRSVQDLTSLIENKKISEFMKYLLSKQIQKRTYINRIFFIDGKRGLAGSRRDPGSCIQDLRDTNLTAVRERHSGGTGSARDPFLDNDFLLGQRL